MSKFSNYNFLIRLGLGSIFLANSLAAFFAPAEFIELINNSFVVSLMPMRLEVFVPLVIGFNDGIIALLLFLGVFTPLVGIWASIWIIGVMVVTTSPLSILEHIGLLFVALALVRGDRYLTKNI